jgi:type II secretory pathway pseudopilin PulG
MKGNGCEGRLGRRQLRQRRSTAAAAGFGLVELLLSLALGLVLCGAVVQALVGDGQIARRFTRQLRERGHQRRALELVRQDLERATAVLPVANPSAVSCGLAGRQVVLQLETPEGTVTYSVGAPPSGIWRGEVLVRCGPAYGLDGRVNPGTAFVSRVLLDGLSPSPTAWSNCGPLAGGTELNGSASLPFSACLDPAGGLVGLRLEQRFEGGGGPAQRIESELLAGAG